MADDWVYTGQPDVASGLPSFQLPQYAPGAFAPKADDLSKRGIFMPGIKAGYNEAVGSGGSAIAAVGNLIGSQAVQDYGQSVYDARAKRSAEVGRPDLDVAPWNANGPSVLPWLGYQAAKQIPNAAAMIGLSAAAPEAMIPGALAKVGGFVPEILGGARGLTGVAAETAGKEFARKAAAVAVTSAPQNIGEAFQSSKADGSNGSGGAAILAGLAATPFDIFEPGGPAFKGLTNAASKTALALGEGKIAKAAGFAWKAANEGIAAGAGEAFAEGSQQAITDALDPTLTPGQRMKNVVEAAVTGGAVGGVFGTAHKLLPHGHNSTNDDIAETVDNVLGLPAPSDANRPPIFVNQLGDADTDLNTAAAAAHAGAWVGNPAGRGMPEIAGLLPAPSEANRPPIQPDLYAGPAGGVAPTIPDAIAADRAIMQPGAAPVTPSGVPVDQVQTGRGYFGMDPAAVQQALGLNVHPDAPFVPTDDLWAESKLYTDQSGLPLFGAGFDQTQRPAPYPARTLGNYEGQLGFPGMRPVEAPLASMDGPQPQGPMLGYRAPNTEPNTQLALDLSTAKGRVEAQRAAIKELAPDTKTSTLNALAGEDEVGTLDKALAALESGKGSEARLKAAQAIVEKAGLMEHPDALQARGEAAQQAMVEAYRTGDQAGLAEARQTLQSVSRSLDLLQQVEARRAPAEPTSAAAAAPAVTTPPVAGTAGVEAPSNPLMAERLKAAQRQQEFTQAQAAVAPTEQEAFAQQQLAAPTRLDRRLVGKGSKVDIVPRQRTVDMLNGLTEAQRETIFNREEFGGDPNAVLSMIENTNSRDIGKLRVALATAAGVDPAEFVKAKAPTAAELARTAADRQAIAGKQAPAAAVLKAAAVEPNVPAAPKEVVAAAKKIVAAAPKQEAAKAKGKGKTETMAKTGQRVAALAEDGKAAAAILDDGYAAKRAEQNAAYEKSKAASDAALADLKAINDKQDAALAKQKAALAATPAATVEPEPPKIVSKVEQLKQAVLKRKADEKAAKEAQEAKEEEEAKAEGKKAKRKKDASAKSMSEAQEPDLTKEQEERARLNNIVTDWQRDNNSQHPELSAALEKAKQMGRDTGTDMPLKQYAALVANATGRNEARIAPAKPDVRPASDFQMSDARSKGILDTLKLLLTNKVLNSSQYKQAMQQYRDIRTNDDAKMLEMQLKVLRDPILTPVRASEVVRAGILPKKDAAPLSAITKPWAAPVDRAVPSFLKKDIAEKGGVYVTHFGEGEKAFGVVMRPDPNEFFPLFETVQAVERDLNFTETVIANDAILSAKRDEMARQARTSNGPFEGATSNVVASEGIPQKQTDFLRGLMNELGMQNVRVFLTSKDDMAKPGARERHNLYGEYISPIAGAGINDYGYAHAIGGETARDFVINVAQGFSEHHTMEVIAHELGHVIEQTALKAAPPEVQAAIKLAHQQWVLSTNFMTAEQMVRTTRNMSMAARDVEALKNLDGQKRIDHIGYIKSFDEWFADNVSRWVSTAARPQSLVEKFFSAVADKLKRLASSILGTKAPNDKVADFLNRMGPSSMDAWKGHFLADPVMRAARAAKTVADLNHNTSGVVDQLWNLVGRVTGRHAYGPKEGMANFKQSLLGWRDNSEMVEADGGRLPGFRDQYKALTSKSAISGVFNARYAEVIQRMEGLPEKLNKAVGQLHFMTQFGIDPRKNWEQHTWLKDSPDAVALKKEVERANGIWNNLVRNDKATGAARTYVDSVHLNETDQYAGGAQTLYNLIVSDPNLRAAYPTLQSPMARFMAKTQHQSSPKAMRDFWRKEVETMTGLATKVYKEQYAKVDKLLQEDTPIDQRTVDSKAKISAENIRAGVAPLFSRVDDVLKNIAKSDDHPYFHLGRDGDNFVSAPLKVGEDGKADPKSYEVINRLVNAELRRTDPKHPGVVVNPISGRNRVFFRVDSLDQAHRIRDILIGLKDHVVHDVESLKSDDPKVVRAGSRTEEGIGGFVSPKWMELAIRNIQSSDLPNKEQLLHQLRDVWMDMLPDSSMAKLIQPRDNIAGFSANAAQNFAIRGKMGANALANLATTGDVTKAYQDMNDYRKEMQVKNPVEERRVKDIMNELLKRENLAPIQSQRTFGDWVRSVNHSMVLGTSPAFIAVSLTQPMTLGWPELARFGGYVNSAKHIASATLPAFSLIQETFAAAKKRGGLGAAADALITPEAIKNWKADPALKDALLALVNRGNLDIGGATREMGRLASGKSETVGDKTLKYAAAAGTYAETFTRLQMAIAAHNAYEAANASTREKMGDRLDYMARTVDNSMFNYATYNAPRQLGKGGFAGPITPIMTQFMSYQVKVTSAIFRELAKAFGDAATTEAEKQGSRRWLASHAVAMTAFAGTLGLPFASILARVAEEAINLVSGSADEPWDAEQAYRNWLADIFGKDVGEVIAKGLPRSLGLDAAGRIGEQDLIPYTKFLTDKRKWEDQLKDLGTTLMGSPTTTFTNLVQGISKVAQGDVVGGLAAGAPTAIRSVARAYQLSRDGSYVDARTGQALPIETPGARAILVQAMGFTPSERAEYSEARQYQSATKGELIRRSSALRNEYATAIEKGDKQAVKETMAEIRKFDMANPGNAIGPKLGATVTKRATNAMLAKQTGSPLGVNPNDFQRFDLSRFANY